MDTAKKPEEIKLDKSGRIRFTAGFFVCAILWMTGLAIVSAVLLPQHLRDIAGEAAGSAAIADLQSSVGNGGATGVRAGAGDVRHRRLGHVGQGRARGPRRQGQHEVPRKLPRQQGRQPS